MTDKEFIERIYSTDGYNFLLEDPLKNLGKDGVERILEEIKVHVVSENWTTNSILRSFHCIKAFTELEENLLAFLKGIPSEKVTPALIPRLMGKEIFGDLINSWFLDPLTHRTVKKAITVYRRHSND